MRALALFFALISLAACQPQPTPQASLPTRTATIAPPTAAPTFTATAPPSPTPAPAPTQTPPPKNVPEVPVTVIPLTQPAAKSSAEFSGMTWYGDYLILLPQYPTFSTTRGDGLVFALPKADILAFLDGTLTGELDPIPIPVIAPDVRWGVSGYEGYEAIAFDGNNAFLTIEAKPDAGMMGHLVRGTMAADLSALTLDAATLRNIPPQAKISNFSDETIFITPNGVGTLYEANGENVNPSPVVHLFDENGNPDGTLPFPNIEYRVTDATAPDANGDFWVINYLFPGDLKKVNPAPDPIAARYGQGATHAAQEGVERLVQFRMSETGIIRTDAPPVQLVLPDAELRNWEGIARLDDRGFLLVTDKYPETILGFVPYSNP